MKKNKVMMGFAAVVVIGGLVAGGLKVSADKQHKEDVAKAQSEVTIVVNKTKAEGPIQIALADLHDEAIPTFLKAGIKQADIDAVAKLITTEEDVLKKIKKEYTEVNTKLATDDLAALTNQLKVIQQKFDVNEAVNKQFKQEEKKVALSGNTRVTGIPLADETTKETVEATKKLIEGLPEDDFLTGVNGLLKEADSQLAQIDVATKKTEALYDKDKVKPDAKRSDYDLAVKETKKIRRESTKKDLNTKLDAVKKVIEDREKKKQIKKQKRQLTHKNNKLQPRILQQQRKNLRMNQLERILTMQPTMGDKHLQTGMIQAGMTGLTKIQPTILLEGLIGVVIHLQLVVEQQLEVAQTQVLRTREEIVVEDLQETTPLLLSQKHHNNLKNLRVLQLDGFYLNLLLVVMNFGMIYLIRDIQDIVHLEIMSNITKKSKLT
jgi:hypothetical protein